jgi:hypothetical protein
MTPGSINSFWHVLETVHSFTGNYQLLPETIDFLGNYFAGNYPKKVKKRMNQEVMPA